MIGAIIGDIVGSIYEWDNIKTKKFEFFDKRCHFTDDTIMTLAIAKSFVDCYNDYNNLTQITIMNMQQLGKKYPYCGYGERFGYWLRQENPLPYQSFGNGAIMRISSVCYVSDDYDTILKYALEVTNTTHNHKHSHIAVEAITKAIYMALNHKTKEEIRDEMNKYYSLRRTLDDIRPKYSFDVTCQGTAPYAILAFLESNSFEDAIRNAISIGGDSDTLAAITGSIAEAFYGVSDDMREKTLTYLDSDLINILDKFEKIYENKN